MRSVVGYNPLEAVPLASIEIACSGAISGVLTRMCVQPLDVVKIRFQLQEEPIKRGVGSKYVSIRHAVSTICREEGLRGLWKGHAPAQSLSVIYGTTQFASFELLTKLVSSSHDDHRSTATRAVIFALCGSAAGCLATVCSYPMDTVRTRLVAQGEPKHYKGMTGVLSSMMREEGGRSVFKGLLPALVEIAPHAGMQFGFYSFCMSLSEPATSGPAAETESVTGRSLACGAAAGLAAKLVVHPLDVVKKRLQIQGLASHVRRPFGRSSTYRGLTHCLTHMARQEGLAGFYKGCLPNLLKASAATALHFAFYEYSCRMFKRRRLKRDT